MDAIVTRLKPDGTLDSTFSGDGVQLITKAGTDEIPSDIALKQNNKIVITGNTALANTNDYAVFVTQTNINGALDKTFNKTGYTNIDLETSGNDDATSVAIQTDGKIVIGGTLQITNDSGYTSNSFLLRYTTNGTLDAGFGTSGKVIYAKPGEENASHDIAIQKDGKIIQVGNAYRAASPYSAFDGNYNYQVIRYKTNGVLDSTFGGYGRTLIDFGNWFGFSNSLNPTPTPRTDYAYACAIQPDGKIVVTGQSSLTTYEASGGGVGGSAVRLLSTGTNYAITSPGDRSANLTNQCAASFSDIDPKLYPDTSLSIVKYRLYKAMSSSYYVLYDSGYGSLSNKPIDIGNYTAVYSSLIDSNQRAYFNLVVTGGKKAGALNFDGIDDRVDLQNMLPVVNNDAYTFESWIKVKGYNKNGGSVIFGNQHYRDSGIIVALSAKGYIQTYQPKVGIVVSSYKVPLNTWTHIAFIQSPAKLDLYVNGEFVQTLLKAPNLHGYLYQSRFYLGAHTDDDTNFDRYFNGEMDEVRIWSKTISQAQLQHNLHCELLLSLVTDLSAEFTFDQGLASCKNPTINTLFSTDYINSGNNNFNSVFGTLQNFTLSGPVSNWVSGYVTDTCTPLSSVRSIVNSAFIAADNKASLRNDFKVMISPNPAQDHFTLQVTSKNLTDKINIRITDISGKVLDVISNVNAGELKHFGSQYKAGIYIANITQGTNRKTIKIVKM